MICCFDKILNDLNKFERFLHEVHKKQIVLRTIKTAYYVTKIR